jgi:hypothetical protein
MTVGYRQRKAGLAPDYICAGPREVDRIEKGYCQRVSGYSLDLTIGAMLVETVTPLALEVALSVQQEMQSRWDEADRLRRLQVDRARYESELARRHFLVSIPTIDSLLRRWKRNGMRSCGHWRRLSKITNGSAKQISSKSAQRNESRSLAWQQIFRDFGMMLVRRTASANAWCGC